MEDNKKDYEQEGIMLVIKQLNGYKKQNREAKSKCAACGCPKAECKCEPSQEEQSEETDQE